MFGSLAGQNIGDFMTKLKQTLCYSLLLSAISVSAQAQTTSLDVLDDEGKLQRVEAQQYMIKYRSKADALSTVDKMQGEMKRAIDDFGIVSAILPLSDVSSLKDDPNIEYFEVDHRRYKMAEEVPYGVTLVQAPDVDNSNVDNQRVCVIDTGYDISHIDLPSAGVTGDDFGTDTGPWNTDGNHHGTHVAGTVAAIGGNDEGVVGVVSSGAMPLHIVKIFDDEGEWTSSSNLIQGVSRCINAGATVINISLGGPGYSELEDNAFNSAFDQGIISVAAAGNDGNTSLNFPASYNNVISIAAVDSAGEHGSYSQRNYQVELAAPGTRVNSTVPDNEYSLFTGTSMATPHAAGVAALVWSNYPDCTNQQIRNTLVATALDRGDEGKDNLYGHGIIQAKAASDMLAQGCDTAPNAGVPQLPPQPEFDPALQNGVPIEGMAGEQGQGYRFYIDLPANARDLSIVTSGGEGDADLYVKFDAEPTRNDYDCRSIDPATDETCLIADPAAGRHHIYVYAWSGIQGVNMTASFETGPRPVLEISAEPDAASFLWTDGTGVDVFANDLIDGNTPTEETVTVTLTDNAGFDELEISPAGLLSVGPSLEPGIHTLTYEVCQRDVATNCANSTIELTAEEPNPISAANDALSTNSNQAGSVNVFANDLLSGVVPTDQTVEVFLIENGGINNMSLSMAGALTVPVNTIVGNYTANYEICEKENPINCASADVSVSVTSPPAPPPPPPSNVSSSSSGGGSVGIFLMVLLSGFGLGHRRREMI